MRCGRIVDSGPYVLGALASAERSDYERHLAGCPICRAEVAEVAGLPGLLGRLEPAMVQRIAAIGTPSADPPGPQLLSRVVAAAGLERRRRMRRRIWVRTATAVAAVCVALIVVFGMGMVGGPSPVPKAAPSLTTMHAVAASAPISAQVALTPVRGGTQISMHCWYAGTSTYGSAHTFGLYVYPRGGGQREQIGSWNAGPGDDVHIVAVTHLATTEIAKVEMDSATGEPLLSYEP